TTSCRVRSSWPQTWPPSLPRSTHELSASCAAPLPPACARLRPRTRCSRPDAPWRLRGKPRRRVWPASWAYHPFLDPVVAGVGDAGVRRCGRAMMRAKIGYGLSGALGAGIIVIGVRFLVAPPAAAAAYGISTEQDGPASDPYLATKGVRDIA